MTLPQALAILKAHNIDAFRSGLGWKAETTWPDDEAIIQEAKRLLERERHDSLPVKNDYT